MGLFARAVILVFVASAVYVAIQINELTKVPPLPNVDDKWWGPGKPTSEDTAIKPFKINVSDKVISDLKQRLNNARPFTSPLEKTQQQYGMNTDLLTEIVDFWKTKYDWREREQWLNKYPQFTTTIQGLNIHFIRVKPKAANGIRVLPLLLLHGWPGSVREFYEMIPLMTTPKKGVDFVFEVIVPSLPGYGFSQGASKPGLNPIEIAVIFKNLMSRLGFEKYYIQGGDWGAVILSHMAILFPDRVLGVHSNACFADTPMAHLKLLIGSIYPPLIVEEKMRSKLYPLSSFMAFTMLEMGYLHLQATKPDTIGVGLNDSPVGLAAYILEKFTTWTQPDWKNRADGGLTKKFTFTSLLDNVMIYWVTNSITTSMRLYSENFNIARGHVQLDPLGRNPITVPSACAKFYNELFCVPDGVLKHKYTNLVHSQEYPDGGHFAAFEVPGVLADDVWTAVGKFDDYHRSK